ncbi:LOW QUALITY PROTEIN: mas-related G-protein coupled receptor member D [Mesocricetus auratus]|uniref:LOW QUALITY PROTEIN: mas-related G-protein coupled receptor member D n=1 Tax=Mesocricetus auratus TaxID=10036 RepID=A0A1U7QZC3_MESAU|nr:LOW QUALITY PROTEIN: mas-related G-protein coupled receptor member D [Mesocricetus auratus]
MNYALNSSPAPGLTISSPTMDSVSWVYFSVTFLAMVTCVLGMAGNSLVIWLMSFRVQRSPFCVYVLNLAVADLLFLLCMASMLSLETRPLFIASTSARIYEGMKRIKYFAYTAGLSLLTAISTQRCLSVLFPIWYKCHQPKHLSAVVCGVLWALALLMNFLASFFCVQFWHPNESQCFWVDMVFTSLILGIFMPIMILSSTILVIRVRKNTLLRRRRPRRLFVVILASVFVFLTCSLPLGIYWFLLYWVGLPQEVLLLYICLSRFSSSLGSSANPVIYFLVGSQKSHRLQESLDAVLGRALQDEPEPDGRETPSMCTNDEV